LKFPSQQPVQAASHSATPTKRPVETSASLVALSKRPKQSTIKVKTPSTAVPSEGPLSNVFADLEFLPFCNSQEGEAPPEVASQHGKEVTQSKADQASKAGTSSLLTRNWSKRTFFTHNTVYKTIEPDILEAERPSSPTRPEIEIGPGGRYLTSLLDNWTIIMLTHPRPLENQTLKGADLDEFATRHAMLVSYLLFHI